MKIPVPKPHRSGQAYVYWQGKCLYFGKYGTPKANQKYQDWLSNLYGNGNTRFQESPLVIDLLARYIESHYVPKDRINAIMNLGPLASHHCHEYTPLVFRKHRDRVASTGTRCARHVNDLMRLVQRIFRWGVSMEMVPLDVYSKLKTVDPLKPYEVKKQAVKRLPAKREDVERTLEELHPTQADMVRLILFTGARPGEICRMRASEVSKDGPHGTWVYRPGKHKASHYGRRRFIAFGRQSQLLISKHWPRAGDYFFPSLHRMGHYRAASLRQAVGHACKRKGVPHWSPYQIRHLRLTELAIDKGLEAAAAVAGHGETQTTRLYQHEPDILQLRGAV